MSEIKNYRVETYAVFVNVDESILKLNALIEKLGFRFVSFTLEELEQSFLSFFHVSQRNFSGKRVGFKDTSIDISDEFFQAIWNHPTLRSQLFFDRKMIMLKKSDDYVLHVKDNDVNDVHSIPVIGLTQKFVVNLIPQLRLLKSEWIDHAEIFQIGDDGNERQLRGYTFGVTNGSGLSKAKFTLSDAETNYFESSFSQDFKPNNLTELAIKNYNLSYHIRDITTKYVTLMTCLESIFNLGSNQITHTISRHLALVVSKNKKEFQDNYARIKKLYQYRSSIVHGDGVKEDLYLLTDELQNFVRKSINYCANLDIDKAKLFADLNARGFSEA